MKGTMSDREGAMRDREGVMREGGSDERGREGAMKEGWSDEGQAHTQAHMYTHIPPPIEARPKR